MRLDLQPWGETMAELVIAARAAEAAGAGVVWAPELHRSAFTTAAALATGTSKVAGGEARIGVGTGIALAFARSAMLTAIAAADLDELSEGRFRLGLGTGVARLNQDWHGVEFERPLPRLRDTVAIIRKVLAGGDPINHKGVRSIRVRGWRRPYAPVREHIPIYLAGVGPAMVALAGEVADGWIAHELCPPADLRDRILPILGKAGRPDFDVVAAACCSVDDDPATARRRAANVVGFYASVRSYAETFGAAGFGEVCENASNALRNGRPADDLGHLVPDEMVDAYTIAGTPAQCAAKIAAYDGLADAIKLSPPSYGLPAEEVRESQDRLLELVGSLR
ncbi:alkanesulfonate monooxygenase SsuD/methylene tetrahydromethanopterin reductase-like flavin-dependent oxidoreductase (luciferase family) [Actinoplanes lutulentus]|uniref:Alkanesulfonate monooxygenase SsuD/methylene tetrahydromethanopterin reductase-like flavin-dependent oxidoreductase (Luciferase family) n=1 Tax=Actinoplanes lutulentus TaxID=1287878 RepID=A0A327ZIZ2_9ACTN|nr:LLM class flavin-dependent oxidoreductase [Actinoplanes lutulentus]MBB2944388.1 alkanesulfonate monooxygenase SsuD/methylene tetrahydromethanopterin reductase-like flavin-dependent oxidoreductase (luciferase family) [Actinoplanes lutulentus]RAK42380.1 alkanesulfonate monooxygenase SsuD/methylene tetrahydromethanopterin reductase-like flavin-dependent oxidoreductase (luciferase family) [Actinoplanes lutulentus]